MPQPKSISNRADKKDGEDLTTMLDDSQRADLTMLIANITESMRDSLVQNFEASAGLDQSYYREGMTEDEKLLSSDPMSADVEEMDKQKRVREENEKDLATLKMKNLKKHSFKAFDQWREQVLLRVGEVVNSRDTVRQQLENTKHQGVGAQTSVKSIGIITETPKRGTNLKFKDLYPPTKTPLTKLSMEQRTLILHSMLLLILSLEHYNALSRVLLLLLTSSLKLPLKTFEQDEYTTAKGLLEGAKEMTAEDEKKKKAEDNRDSRKWKVGIATAAGAAIIGVTGGLAAPLVAAGVGSVMGGLGLGATTAATYLGSVAGSTYLVGGLFGAYGGRMTGRMMDNYAKEVEDFEFIPVHSNQRTSEDEKEGARQASEHDHKLRVTICISGWLTEKEDIVKPWRVLGTGAEVFALKYELEAMLKLGNAMNGLVTSAAWGYAQKQLIAQTVFADLAAAMWPIGLMKAARVIDNPFNVAKSRSEKAGEVLADALINRAQGERPVTLIAYSLGARAIFACLMSLAKRKAFGLVENAVLVGAPIPSDVSDWRMLRTVVSGRLINVYSQNDYVLGFMYRTSSLQYGVAGLQAIDGLAGVENIDVSEEVSGHLRYRYLIGSILKKIGFEDIDMQAVAEEKEALAKMEEEERKNSLQAQRRRLLRRQSTGGKEDEAQEAEQEATEIEQEVEAKTQKSLLTRAIEYFYTPRIPDTGNAEDVKANLDDMAKNPAKAGNAAQNIAQDAQGSTRSLTQRAYAALPSMPQLARSEEAHDVKGSTKSPGTAQETSKDVANSAPTYKARVESYLPSMPKNIPSMPGLGGRGKAEQQPVSKPTQAVQSTANAGRQAAKEATKTTDELVRPTVKNVLKPQDNPAVGAIRDTSEKAPVIHQSVPPGVKEKSGEATAAVGTTAQNTAQTVSRVGEATADQVAKTGKPLVSQAVPEGKSRDSQQSYTNYAYSYLPSVPKSIPGWSGTRKPAPKLERRGSSGIKSPPPKLSSRTNSGLKNALPKLGPRSSSSGTKPSI